jgi:hypothetical protein
MFISKKEEQKLTQEFFDNCDSWDCLDEGILPYLKQINSISGIITSSSCSGHFEEYEEDNIPDITSVRGFLLFYVTENKFIELTTDIFPKLNDIPLKAKSILSHYDDFISFADPDEIQKELEQEYDTGINFGINYNMGNIRLKLDWYPDNFDEVMQAFINELKK